MKAKLRSYYVFSLYGAIRGVEGAFIGSAIFTALWIPAEMTQDVLLRMFIILIPGILISILMASIIPGAIGGILLSALLHNNLLRNTKHQVVMLKGSMVGASAGLLMWWILWTFDPLNPPISIERNLFIYYSFTGILSAAIGGAWAAKKLSKDSNYVLKDN